MFLMMAGFLWAVAIIHWYRKDKRAEKERAQKDKEDMEASIAREVEIRRRVAEATKNSAGQT